MRRGGRGGTVREKENRRGIARCRGRGKEEAKVRDQGTLFDTSLLLLAADGKNFVAPYRLLSHKRS